MVSIDIASLHKTCCAQQIHHHKIAIIRGTDSFLLGEDLETEPSSRNGIYLRPRLNDETEMFVANDKVYCIDK